jgi:ribose 1,5-bisphosphokinase
LNYNHLVIVIGPSGSGKDTLISSAKTLLTDKPAFYFTTREITRPPDAAGERHISVSEDLFLQRREAGAYAITWHAHDTWYGIDRSIEDHLAEGKVVIFNGSRAAIEEAKKIFPGVKIIFIDAPDSVLAQRLTARGRESDLQVRERLARNELLRNIPDGSIVLTNAGPIQHTLDEFVGILQGILFADEDNSAISYSDNNYARSTEN